MKKRRIERERERERKRERGDGSLRKKKTWKRQRLSKETKGDRKPGGVTRIECHGWLASG
jgi:hypothetical protein